MLLNRLEILLIAEQYSHNTGQWGEVEEVEDSGAWNREAVEAGRQAKGGGTEAERLERGLDRRRERTTKFGRVAPER